MIASPVCKTEENLTTYKGHTTSNEHLHTTLKQATCVRRGTVFINVRCSVTHNSHISANEYKVGQKYLIVCKMK